MIGECLNCFFILNHASRVGILINRLVRRCRDAEHSHDLEEVGTWDDSTLRLVHRCEEVPHRLDLLLDASRRVSWLLLPLCLGRHLRQGHADGV